MANTDRDRRIQYLTSLLSGLTNGQLQWVESIVIQFDRPHSYARSDVSDIVSPCVLQDFGDSLRIHHCFSREAFTKDKFEYALERIMNRCGNLATLATRGNPGHDITLNGERFSLKTQANRGLRPDRVHISKFMELGKGTWGDNEADLTGLREQFFAHMESYERILVLRTLSRPPIGWTYELIEIPKLLLLKARDGSLTMMTESKQFPKPGYCRVFDHNMELLFELYFDGGTERKLQVRKVNTSKCIVHATWAFPDLDLEI